VCVCAHTYVCTFLSRLCICVCIRILVNTLQVPFISNDYGLELNVVEQKIKTLGIVEQKLKVMSVQDKGHAQVSIHNGEEMYHVLFVYRPEAYV